MTPATTFPGVRAIDAYLTRKACLTWPRSVVYKEEDGSFTLERPNQNRLQLATRFTLAREALSQLRRAAEEPAR